MDTRQYFWFTIKEPGYTAYRLGILAESEAEAKQLLSPHPAGTEIKVVQKPRTGKTGALRAADGHIFR